MMSHKVSRLIFRTHPSLFYKQPTLSSLQSSSIRNSSTTNERPSYLPKLTPYRASERVTQLQGHLSRTFTTSTSSKMPTEQGQTPGNNNADFKISELFNVKGKIALVTGGGSGIGLMITQALAVNGAKVYITGRTQEKLDTVAKEFGKDIEGEIIPVQADMTSKSSISKLYDQISSKESHLDVLVNNAGVDSATLQTEAKSAEEMKKNCFDNEDSTIEDWQQCFQTNVPQIFFMTMCFLPLLQKASEHQHGYSGCVLNTSSISGIVHTAQHHFAYNASKAAVIHLNKMLAYEIAQARLKIRVNSIAPGVFPSEMTAGESDEKQKSAIPKEKYESKTSAQRPGNDRDMGNAALFVVTNQYLNGQTIPVDGGYIVMAGA